MSITPNDLFAGVYIAIVVIILLLVVFFRSDTRPDKYCEECGSGLIPDTHPVRYDPKTGKAIYNNDQVCSFNRNHGLYPV